ncbi:hypothetical protein EV702DRAFT_1102651 [Suillus placidus]|uniref:Uncharacterized protein n=1 Tax=Suillus placidus TaxID=48579 RepID=A0A9P6ZVR4_9AGAM|nr:hypothetical protein EV702DRAFT_1102651 [Suillus placidus]
MTFLYLSVRYIGISYAGVNILKSFDILRDRCGVSEILDQLVISLYDCKQLHHHVFGIRLDEFCRKCPAGRHHDYLVACHVPAIQEGADLPRCHLPDRHDCLRSDCRKIRQKYFRRGAHSGDCQCDFDFEGNAQLLIQKTWVLGTVWEAIALCLAVWVAVKHFHQQPPTGSIMGDCFTVLMKTHASGKHRTP